MRSTVWPLERLAADEVVVSRLELEVHEVGFGDEPRRGDWRRPGRAGLDRILRRRWRFAAGRPSLVALRVLFSFIPFLLFLLRVSREPSARSRVAHSSHCLRAASPTVTPSKRTGLRTCRPSRTYHVLTPLAIDGHPARTEHFDLLDFVEDALLERLPVDLALLEHFRHEGVERVVRCRCAGGRSDLSGRRKGPGAAEQTREHEHRVRAGESTFHESLRKRLALSVDERGVRPVPAAVDPARSTGDDTAGPLGRADPQRWLSG